MRKKDTFINQKLIVLPKKVKLELKNNPLTKDLYITDIGYFPEGKHHYRSRKKGSDEHILIFCLDGYGWIKINGQQHTLSKNTYYIIPKNTPHVYAAAAENPWTIYWAHFKGKKADSFLHSLEAPRELDSSKVSRIKERFELFEEIYLNLESGYNHENMEYCSILFMHLLGSLKYVSQYRKIKMIQHEDAVSRAILYMKNNLQHKLSLAEIARYCELSISHFSLLFKKQTSYAPVEYLIFLRMQQACNLLEFSSFKINKIAEKVGYEDPYYFSRLFKNVMGKSPSSYRNSLQKQ